MITLSEEKLAEIIADAKAELVAHLIRNRGRELELLEAIDVSAILRMDKRTWEKLIPRVVIAPGVYRYAMEDLRKFIEERKERV